MDHRNPSSRGCNWLWVISVGKEESRPILQKVKFSRKRIKRGREVEQEEASWPTKFLREGIPKPPKDTGAYSKKMNDKLN